MGSGRKCGRCIYTYHIMLPKVSDVVEALTHVVQASRLASRTDPKVNREGTDGRVLADLISLISFGQFTETVNSVARMSLEDCDPATLKTFLREACEAVCAPWGHGYRRPNINQALGHRILQARPDCKLTLTGAGLPEVGGCRGRQRRQRQRILQLRFNCLGEAAPYFARRGLFNSTQIVPCTGMVFCPTNKQTDECTNHCTYQNIVIWHVKVLHLYIYMCRSTYTYTVF